MNTNISEQLKAAAQEGDIDLLYVVIGDDPFIQEHIDLIPFVETPLHIAASMGHIPFTIEIMNLKPSFAWKLNPQGFSPIHLAMQNDQKYIVSFFVHNNKDLVRVKGREGLTPLHFASQNGEVEFLAEFLFLCPDHSHMVRNSLRYVVRVRVRGSSVSKNSVREGVYRVGTLWVRGTLKYNIGALVLEKNIQLKFESKG